MYKKSKAQIISDAICGVVMLLSVLVFLLIGILAGIWHPTWIIIPSSGILCGVISIIVNTYSNLKNIEEKPCCKEEKITENKEEIKEEK